MKYIIARINSILQDVDHHSPTANHFYRLKCHLLTGKKLTKKMRENLNWILQDLEKNK